MTAFRRRAVSVVLVVSSTLASAQAYAAPSARNTRVASTTSRGLGADRVTTVLPELDFSRYTEQDFLLPRSYYEKRMAKLIQEWQGVPYVWGGNTRRGTDCSGFVQGVFRELGLRIPHGSAYLLNCEIGPAVTGQWKYGDVLVFKGHAAFYTGNGKTAETKDKKVGRWVVGNRKPLVVRRFMDALCSAGLPDPMPTEPSGDQPDFPGLIELIDSDDSEGLRARLDGRSNLFSLVDRAGANLLHWAADRGSVKCAAMLLDFGISINSRNNRGVTPLHVASALGREEVVRLLLDRGADANTRDFRSRTPLSVAQDANQSVIVGILLASRPDMSPMQPTTSPALDADEPGYDRVPALSSREPARRSEPAAGKPSDPLVPATSAQPVPLDSSSTPVTRPADSPSLASTPRLLEPGIRLEDPQAARLLDMLNAERSRLGRSALEVDPVAQKIAQAKAEDIARYDYFSHTSPNYGTPADMLRREGASVKAWAENIAGCGSADAAHAGLMRSTSHKSSIANPRYHRVGIGVAPSERYGLVFVELLISG